MAGINGLVGRSAGTQTLRTSSLQRLPRTRSKSAFNSSRAGSRGCRSSAHRTASKLVSSSPSAVVADKRPCHIGDDSGAVRLRVRNADALRSSVRVFRVPSRTTHSIAAGAGRRSTRNLWEWTLTHAAGHVLGVPAKNSHVWVVPGLGPHCTRPECVMYTGVDWRVVLSGLLHGWLIDFCASCAGELADARAQAREKPRATVEWLVPWRVGVPSIRAPT